VEDAEDFERCLTYKYNEMQFIWEKYEICEELDELEAHALRCSARIAATNATTTTKSSNSDIKFV